MSAYHNRNGASVAERLANRSVRDANGCLIWQGAKLPFGHGTITAPERRKRRTHCVAWELVNGPIPAGMCVCHKCDVPACINPDHLFLGTIADNNADMIRKGRNVAHPGEKNGRARLTPEQVAAIATDPRVQKAIAADYGIKQPQVSRIKRGASWPSPIATKGE